MTNQAADRFVNEVNSTLSKGIVAKYSWNKIPINLPMGSTGNKPNLFIGKKAFNAVKNILNKNKVIPDGSVISLRSGPRYKGDQFGLAKDIEARGIRIMFKTSSEWLKENKSLLLKLAQEISSKTGIPGVVFSDRSGSTPIQEGEQHFTFKDIMLRTIKNAPLDWSLYME